MATKKRTLGSVLKTKREAQGMSMHGLAGALGIYASSVLRFESDERRPGPDLLKRLARVLKTDPEELLALGNHGLPTFAPYLRAKYDLSPEAITELEQHFAAVTTKSAPKRRGKA